MNIALSIVDRGFLQQDPAVAVLPTIIDKYLPLSIADIGHTLPVPHRASAALYPDWRVSETGAMTIPMSVPLFEASPTCIWICGRSGGGAAVGR
jgi:hypothetical protein